MIKLSRGLTKGLVESSLMKKVLRDLHIPHLSPAINDMKISFPSCLLGLFNDKLNSVVGWKYQTDTIPSSFLFEITNTVEQFHSSQLTAFK